MIVYTFRGSDDSCIYYTKLDDEHRPHQVWLHLLGTPQSEDTLLFQDDDGLFNVSVDKTLSGECVIISTDSIETSEAHVIFLPNPSHNFEQSQSDHLSASKSMVLVQKRELGLRYNVDHQGSYLLVVTNEGGAKNGKLMRVKINDQSERSSLTLRKENWTAVRPYDPLVEITHVLPFKRCVAVFGRSGGGQKIWIYCPSASNDQYTWNEVTFDEECYSVFASHNRVYDTDTIRVKYSSLLTPQQVQYTFE